MFMELPALMDDEETISKVDINPFHITSMEPMGSGRCILTMINGYEWHIALPRGKLRKLVSDFVKENVLSKIYKQMKDDQQN
jgi:hypothetical protein